MQVLTLTFQLEINGVRHGLRTKCVWMIVGQMIPVYEVEFDFQRQRQSEFVYRQILNIV